MFGLATVLVALSIGLAVWYMATKTIVAVARDRGSNLPSTTFWLFSLFFTPLSALLLAILSVSGTSTAAGAAHGHTTTAASTSLWGSEGSAGVVQNPVTSFDDRASQGSVDFIAFIAVAALVLIVSLFLLLGR